MAKPIKLPIIEIHVGRFLFLLISLILWFILSPFLESLMGLSTLVDLFVTFVLLSGVFAVIQRKGVFIFSLSFAIFTVLLRWSLHLLNISSLEPVNHILSILFMGFIVGIILSYLFTEKEITSDVIMGAICGYFMIGFLWNNVYALLEVLEPNSFQFSQASTAGAPNFIYYSFVTLTTLGYGDITPVSNPAQSLSLLEAVMGQLYLAILVARLVGIHIAQSHSKESS